MSQPAILFFIFKKNLSMKSWQMKFLFQYDSSSRDDSILGV